MAPDPAADLVAALRQRGFVLSLEADVPRVAPSRKLTPDDLASLKANRKAIIDLLEREENDQHNDALVAKMVRTGRTTFAPGEYVGSEAWLEKRMGR